MYKGVVPSCRGVSSCQIRDESVDKGAKDFESVCHRICHRSRLVGFGAILKQELDRIDVAKLSSNPQRSNSILFRRVFLIQDSVWCVNETYTNSSGYENAVVTCRALFGRALYSSSNLTVLR